LQVAAPVKMRGPRRQRADVLRIHAACSCRSTPAGVTAIKANLVLMQAPTSAAAAPTPYIYGQLTGQLTVSRTDDQKAEWQYVSQVGVWAWSEAEKSPSIKVPNPDNVKASLDAKPSRGMLAIGLRIGTPFAILTDVRKDGQPVQVKMVVTDASGAEIASKVGPLSDFGFS